MKEKMYLNHQEINTLSDLTVRRGGFASDKLLSVEIVTNIVLLLLSFCITSRAVQVVNTEYKKYSVNKQHRK